MKRFWQICLLALPLWVACGAGGSGSGVILLACDSRTFTGECSEVRRGSGQGSFEGSCSGEVEACPEEGVLATCSESSDDYAYEIVYYYANANLSEAEMDCEFFDGTWMPVP